MEDIGKMLVLLGILLVIVGGVVFVLGKIPGIGSLPGDIVIQRDNFSCVLPLVSSILLSLALTIILNILLRTINK